MRKLPFRSHELGSNYFGVKYWPKLRYMSVRKPPYLSVICNINETLNIIILYTFKNKCLPNVLFRLFLSCFFH